MYDFNKRQYETIAKVLRSVKPLHTTDAPYTQWERMCLAFLNHFRQDNPAFDSDRFLKACKGE